MLEATTRTANISFDGKVLITELLEDVTIEIEDVNDNYHIVMDIVNKDLTKKKKYVSLVITAMHNSITREAREDANKPEKYENCIAQAIIVKSLATRLLGNFFIRFARPTCPQKIFQNREDGLEWLDLQWEQAMRGQAA